VSIRVGRINRHEDVHGVSGTGEHVADVFEASDGTGIVVWLGKDGSTNVYKGLKNITNVHGHGGKTEVEWLWEQEADPDPMDAVIEKKVAEAGLSQPLPVEDNIEADKEAEAEAIAEKIVEEAAEAVDRVGKKVAEKLAAKVAQVTEEASEE
jgi:hypothetical protein